MLVLDFSSEETGKPGKSFVFVSRETLAKYCAFKSVRKSQGKFSLSVNVASRLFYNIFLSLAQTFFSTVCSYHVTYVFQSESTLYSCLNVKELLARSWREIWSLSDYNWAWTQNHLVHKRTLNHQLSKFRGLLSF